MRGVRVTRVGRCCAVPTNGAERGLPDGSKEMGHPQIASQRHVRTLRASARIGIGGSEVHRLVWGLLLCRVYRMAKQGQACRIWIPEMWMENPGPRGVVGSLAKTEMVGVGAHINQQALCGEEKEKKGDDLIALL